MSTQSRLLSSQRRALEEAFERSTLADQSFEEAGRNGHDSARLFGFIRANQAVFRIATMCRVLGVSESGYHAWCARGQSARTQRDQAERLGSRDHGEPLDLLALHANDLHLVPHGRHRPPG